MVNRAKEKVLFIVEKAFDFIILHIYRKSKEAIFKIGGSGTATRDYTQISYILRKIIVYINLKINKLKFP